MLNENKLRIDECHFLSALIDSGHLPHESQ